MSRAEELRTMTPSLIADVTLYETARGGRSTAVQPGWGCPCVPSKCDPIIGYDARFLLGDDPMEPGERRRLGLVFSGGEEAAAVMRAATKFYLWEGRIIGEASVVEG